jgi:hypothetical protein
MTPGQRDLFTKRARKAPPAREIALQCMVADVLKRWISPGWIFTHIGHGGLRTKTTAIQLKRAGLMPGWPDLILLSPDGRPHFLELKRRGGKLSDAQKRFAAWCREHGVRFEYHDSFDGALKTLRECGAVRTEISAPRRNQDELD